MGNVHPKLPCTPNKFDSTNLHPRRPLENGGADGVIPHSVSGAQSIGVEQNKAVANPQSVIDVNENMNNSKHHMGLCETNEMYIVNDYSKFVHSITGNHDKSDANMKSDEKLTPDRKQINLIKQKLSSKLPTTSENQQNVSTSLEKTTVKVSPRPRYSSGYVNDVHNRSKFTMAICKQNEVATTAIQSLDSLSKQIHQHIVSIQNPDPKDGNIKVHSECVYSALVLIRKLLLDAQIRFCKMVEENKQLASHIDTTLQTANQEVSMLRTELASTSSKLKQMNIQTAVVKADKCTQVDRVFGVASQRNHDPSKDVQELKMTIQTLTKGNEQLVEDYKHLLGEHDQLKLAHEDLKLTNENLRAEMSRLQEQLQNCEKGCEELHQPEGACANPRFSYGEIKLELIQARQELIRAKEVLQGMKSDRKRLKGEKLDLLSQMKQLYGTLEEKETELRDFIRNYEQRVKESDEMVKQFAKEKENVEREKWEIINKAKDAAERAMFLKAQLESKEVSIKELEAELKEAKEQLDSNTLSSSTAPASDGNIINDVDDDDDDDDDEVFPAVDGNGFSTMEESSVLNCIFTQEVENNGQILSTSPVSVTDSLDTGSMFKWFTHSSDFDLPLLEPKPSKKKKKSFGSLSRVFSRSRMRRSMVLSHAESVLSDDCQKLCLLSQDNYQEKLNTIEKMVGVHMKEWRAPQVLAWLEITLAMPMYAQNCLTNVKSGRVLLGLSDSELSAALGVINPMHRRKLRIAIEQHRNPHDIKYLKASEMDPTWIAHRCLPDLGLPQYTDVFEEQLCDGHVLNTLTRRDLEKHFSVHRKFHQSSILHAVELLRRIDFNKEKLYHRRNQCENKDTDLIVWTNERLMKWIRSIDLGEYCESLVESGVHGAVMVLEPSFNADTLASILGIPPSKSYLRRHLATELDHILKPARAALDATEVKEKGSDSSVSSTGKTSSSSQDRDQLGFDERGRRKSHEEGRAILVELLGRKCETPSTS